MFKFRQRLPKPNPDKEQEKIDQISGEELGWKDKLAMILSAYLTIGLPVIVLLLVMVFVCMWLFGIL